MKVTLEARTPFGLNAQEYFREEYTFPDDGKGFSEIALKRKFSLKYGVDLDKITVIVPKGQ